jgi:hypothetical protein
MTKTQWQEQFGPINSLCKTVRDDPTMARCSRNAQTAAAAMQNVCCTGKDECADGAPPSHCTGACADAFLPFFETCGTLLVEHDSESSLADFYNTCSSQGTGIDGTDDTLCHDNNGNSPWVDISFEASCSVWVKYVDAKTKKTSELVRLVSVAGVSVIDLLETSRHVCGADKMTKRFSEDFSGIMSLASIGAPPRPLPRRSHTSIAIMPHRSHASSLSCPAALMPHHSSHSDGFHLPPPAGRRGQDRNARGQPPGHRQQKGLGDE